MVILGGKARLASFFVKRVYGFSFRSKPLKTSKFKRIDFIFLGIPDRILNALANRTAALITDASICNDCGFWSTRDPFSETDLMALYRDYRSTSYNNERDSFEPGYKTTVAPFLGTESEARIRNKRLCEYLAQLPILGQKKPRKLLDWGGADGRFLPSFDWDTERFTYEVSNSPAIPEVTKIDVVEPSAQYDYIQIAHVLEHLPNPREALQNITSHLESDGLLYVELPLEVPADLSPEQVIDQGMELYIHEHINKFTPRSLEKMILSLDLFVHDISVDRYDAGWSTVSVIRCLSSPTATSNALSEASRKSDDNIKSRTNG